VLCKRINAVGDKPPYAVTLEYEDHNQLENGSGSKTIMVTCVRWYFDVSIALVSASATSIKFTVDGGAGMKITLVDANVTLKDSAGAAIAHTFLWLMPMEFIHCTICKWIIN
jgi:hypothetical protein